MLGTKGEPCDVAEVMEREAKETLNVCFFGDVHAGKSTLCGRLAFQMLDVGVEQEKELEDEVKDKGVSASARYTWLMDRLAEERDAGHTLKTSLRSVFRPGGGRTLALADTPGRPRLTREIISALWSADVVVLVVGATTATVDCIEGSRTSELALLARALGVEEMVVCVNKMDEVNYDESEWNKLLPGIRSMLKTARADPSRVPVIPVSSTGSSENLAKSTEAPVTGNAGMSWFKGWKREVDGTEVSGRTLEEALDAVAKPSKYKADQPLRLAVNEVFKIGGVGTVPAGMLCAGTLRKGMRVHFSPSGEEGEVKSLWVGGVEVEGPVEAGCDVAVNVHGVSASRIKRGEILSEAAASNAGAAAKKQAVSVETFKAQIQVLYHPNLIHEGFEAAVCVHNAFVACRIVKIESKAKKGKGKEAAAATGSKGSVSLKTGETAVVTMRPLMPLSLDTYDDCHALGRFVVYGGGVNRVIGIGRVSQVTALPASGQARTAKKGRKTPSGTEVE